MLVYSKLPFRRMPAKTRHAMTLAGAAASNLGCLTMKVTLELPDEFVLKLPATPDDLRRVLELAIRKWNAEQSTEFSGIADLLETLASLPSAAEVLALRPSHSFQKRAGELLSKNRATGLLPDEEREWQQYEYVEHLVRLAKARAAQKLKNGDE